MDSMNEDETRDSKEDDKIEEEDYDDDESELTNINGYESNAKQEEEGANNGRQEHSTRKRRNTARPATYKQANEDSDNNNDNDSESDSDYKSIVNNTDNDSKQSSKCMDDYGDSEHEENTYGSDNNDDDASLHTGDEDNMSDNDVPQQPAMAMKQTKIEDCKAFTVRK